MRGTFGSDVDEDDALALEEGEGDVEVLEVVHLEARVDVEAGAAQPLAGEELEEVAQRHAAGQVLLQSLQLHLPLFQPVVAPGRERLDHNKQINKIINKEKNNYESAFDQRKLK